MTSFAQSETKCTPTGLGNTDREASSTDGGVSDTLSEEVQEGEKVVLITGGAGFIGSHVADFLLTRGDKVVIVDEMNEYYDVRLKNANLEHLYSSHGNNCVVYEGDICDEQFMTKLWEKENPTHVCHLAARAGVRPSIVDPYIYVHSNVEGKCVALNALIAYLGHSLTYI